MKSIGRGVCHGKLRFATGLIVSLPSSSLSILKWSHACLCFKPGMYYPTGKVSIIDLPSGPTTIMFRNKRHDHFRDLDFEKMRAEFPGKIIAISQERMRVADLRKKGTSLIYEFGMT